MYRRAHRRLLGTNRARRSVKARWPSRGLAPLIVFSTMVLVTGCSFESGTAEVSGVREIAGPAPAGAELDSAVPTPTPTVPDVAIFAGRARALEQSADTARALRASLADSSYKPGWLVWIDWVGTIVGINLDPDSDEAFAFETGITNIAAATITTAGVVIVDSKTPEVELFIDWSGTAHAATSWLVDSDGVVVRTDEVEAPGAERNGTSTVEEISNLATGETVTVAVGSGPPDVFSATGPYVEWGGETFEWTWSDGLTKLGAGGVAAWSGVPAPVAVLRDLCEPDAAPCPLSALAPGDGSSSEQGGVEAPNASVDGYAIAPDRHAAVARGDTGWELVSAGRARIPLAETTQPWWISAGKARWGLGSNLVAIVGEELALFDGRSGAAVGTVGLPRSVADVAFVDLSSAPTPIVRPSFPPTTPRFGKEIPTEEGANFLSPDPARSESDISFLDQKPGELAETFRSIGVESGWVVASLGLDLLAIDVANGESRSARLPAATSAYAVTPFGVAALDEDRLVLIGWSESNESQSSPAVLQDGITRGEIGEDLTVHRDTEGREVVVASSTAQTTAIALEAEPPVRTLKSAPTLGDWPFSSDFGPGPLVMPFGGRAKQYSWDQGWTASDYDRILLSGARYLVADTCATVPGDCERQLIDRAQPTQGVAIDAGLDPVAISPDESTIIFTRRGAGDLVTVLNSDDGNLVTELFIRDDVVTMLNEDLVLTLGESYELYSIRAQQAVLRTRTGSVVALLDELLPREDFDGEFFPDRRPEG